MALILVMIVVVSIAIGALWGGLLPGAVPAVSWQEVATSPVVPLGVVVGLRFACTTAALYTLLSVYFDRRGLELGYLEARVTLRRHRRWTTFTVWCFTLLFFYFTLATYCSAVALIGHGATIPPAVLAATRLLFEISYPMSILVTTVVSFVLIPVASRRQHPTDRMLRWRPQMMHNGNVLMMQLAMLMAPLPVTLAHLPYTVLFGCSYALFAWYWFRRTGVYYYFFLDYRHPYAVLAYLGLFAALGLFYGLGGLVSLVARQADSRWWTYPCIIVATFGITRFRTPAIKAPPAARST